MLPEELLRDFLKWVKEDVPFWDLTTEALIPSGTVVESVIISEGDYVVACTEELAGVLELLGIDVLEYVPSGSLVRNGSVVMRLRGDARKLLTIERTLLNLLTYLSGVATRTKEFVDAAKSVNPKAKVAATRKVVPGLRALVKKAVRAGGGDTHRLSLSDAYIIKDNHLAIVGDLREAIRRVRSLATFMHKIEVEVSKAEEALVAAKEGADVIMLDNVTPTEVRRTVELLKREGLRDRVIIEVSGGINLRNVKDYVRAGADIVSTSELTMNPVKVNMSMEVVKVVSRS